MNEPTRSLAAFIGIDWADQEHAVCWRGVEEKTLHHETLRQEPGALAAWAAGMQQRFGGRPVGVCLEQSRGPLIYALSAYPWLVLYPINPKSLARYREALSPSRAKDDPSDAALLCQFLAFHQERLKPWRADEPHTRHLRLLLENREKLVDQRTALTHQLRALLKGYFPQALEWAGDLLRPMAWAFLLKWPTLSAVQAASKKALLNFYYAHGVRRGDLIAQVPEKIRGAVPLVQDAALVESSVLLAQALCRQLQALEPFIERHDAQIKELYDQHPDRELFSGLPGAGPVMGPRLLAAFGTDRQRFSSASEVQQLAGIAPVTERSAKSCWVHWRWAAPAFLRQSFHEHALHSLARSTWARAYYDQQRARGKGHQAAVRALAFKWIRVLFACWKNREAYDETRYLQSLRRHGSPLALHLCTT